MLKLSLAVLFSALTLQANATTIDINRDGVLNGMARPGSCSGSIVKLGSNNPKVYILTNGHCVGTSMDDGLATQKGDTVNVNLKYGSDLDYIYAGAFDQEGKSHFLHVVSVVYATMKNTDIGLVEIEEDLKFFTDQKIKIYELEAKEVALNQQVTISSGYWIETQDCIVNGITSLLAEGPWKWNGSFSLADSCQVRGGWSGTPVISKETGRIIGVVNTTNEDDQNCTLNNPCEIDSAGKKTHFLNRAYAQRTQDILGCVDENGIFSLELAACKLPKPIN